jgi:mannosyltransferase OCH1-like enzyme
MQQIPKTLHFFWGEKERGPLMQKCVASWEKFLPEYTQKEWGVDNYDVNKTSFTKKAFAEKKWAFLSDYIRLDILYQYGGVYVDTDIQALKSFDNLLDHGVFVGMESDTHANPSIIGAQKNHWLIKEVLDEYDTMEEYTAIPIILTKVLNRYTSLENKLITYEDITIYPKEYFYPFGFEEKFTSKCVTPKTYTIHWWNHSWSSKKARFLKKVGLLHLAVRLKKIFR